MLATKEILTAAALCAMMCLLPGLECSARADDRPSVSGEPSLTRRITTTGTRTVFSVTPAMAAGVTDHVWEVGEIVDLLGT